MSWLFGFLLNELPFVAFFWLAASTLLAAVQGDLTSPIGLTAFALAILTTEGSPSSSGGHARRGRPSSRRWPWLSALDGGPGSTPGWSGGCAAALPLTRILFGPFFVRQRDVRRVANIPYGDAGKRNLLDVYHHRGRPSGGPILVYLHGGGFRSGRKNREARPLLYRLASQGWVCISANYRLAPAARFPDYLVDVKKVVAWVREHGHEYGADTAWVFVAGSSGGGHLASLAGLTPSDPSLQSGFERADTSVAAVISLYGYYGPDRHQCVTAFHAVRVRPPRCAALLRRAWRPRHLSAGRRRSPLPGDAAPGLVAAGRVRRAPRGAAHVRPVPFDPLRDADRWDRGLRGLGAFDERSAHRGDWSRSTDRWMKHLLPARHGGRSDRGPASHAKDRAAFGVILIRGIGGGQSRQPAPLSCLRYPLDLPTRLLVHTPRGCTEEASRAGA